MEWVEDLHQNKVLTYREPLKIGSLQKGSQVNSEDQGSIRHYDDDESYCEGDPVLEELDLPELERLQHQVDVINEIENPVEQLAQAKTWVEELNNGTPTV